LAHRGEDIYFRSDVHWTALGAYYAYTAFCRSAGITPASLENDFTQGTYEPFLGGLYSQIYRQPQAARLKNNPEKLDYYVPKTAHQLTLYKMGNLNASYDVDNIKNKTYAISRPFLMLTKGNVKPEVQAFLDFILGDKGQEIVGKTYITIK
jgi:ABC-type molybdate transport system substrate-binding protein